MVRQTRIDGESTNCFTNKLSQQVLGMHSKRTNRGRKIRVKKNIKNIENVKIERTIFGGDGT